MVKALQVLGVIPARAHSTRFPFKVLAPIQNKPMIQYVWEAARKSNLLTRVVVATDHADILKSVQSFGGEAIMTPDTFESGSDRVAFIAKDSNADIIVNLQGDEPLIPSEAIDGLIESLVQHPQSGLATLAVKKHLETELRNPHLVKVVFDATGRALYFSRSPLLTQANGGFYKHIGIYAYRRNTLLEFCKLPQSGLEKAERLEQLRALENGIQIQVFVISQDTIAVDVPEDILKVEDSMRKLKEDALKCLD